MTKDMTKGSPARLILGFALPLLAGMLFQQLYNFVDTMIVGRFLGVHALAGVGATGSINFLVIGFCMGICSGFAIPVAQRFGARKEEEMREFAANGALLSLGISALLTVFTVVFCRDILTLMDTPAECFEEAYNYIVVIFAGIPFIVLYNLLSGYLRSLGDSRTPLLFLLLSSALNVVLDLVLILNFHLGVMGAALATVISQAISGLLCLLFIALKAPLLHPAGSEWLPRRQRLMTLCAYGVPMGLQYSVTAIGSVILQTAINSLGAVVVAAFTAGNRVMGFLMCPFDALGSTMATYAAQNVGAHRYERLNKGLLSASLMGCAYSVIALVVSVFLGPAMVRLFVSGEGNAALIEIAHYQLVAGALFFPLLLLVNTVRFTIQGMGFSILAVIAGVMEMLARGMVGALLVPVFGVSGAVLGGPMAWLFADAFLVPAYFLCRRKLMGRGFFPRRHVRGLRAPLTQKGAFVEENALR